VSSAYSIRRRLLLRIGGTLVVLLLVIAFGFARYAQEAARRSFDQLLSASALTIAGSMRLDGESYTAVPLVREPYRGIDWSRALVELVDAVARGGPHRAGAEHAAHVVEVLEAIAAAASTGGAVAVASSFPPPQPLEWAAAAGRS